MIRQAEISKMAYQLGLGEKTIEKDYILTWLLHAIAKSSFNSLLALKGGTAIKKIYVPDYRFSEDLDFTVLEQGIDNHDLRHLIEGLFPGLLREVNLQIVFDHLDEHQTGNLTLYLNYSGPLRSQIEKRKVKVDFSHDESLVFALLRKPIQSPYSDCRGQQDLLNVYSMEEILTEKIRSLITRSEPRDLFDVHYILNHQLADIKTVCGYCEPKFEAKNLQTSDVRTVLDRKYTIFKRNWVQSLRGQMAEIPDYDRVIRETKRILTSNF